MTTLKNTIEQTVKQTLMEFEDSLNLMVD